TLQLAQESHEKMKQMNKEIKLANYTKINHLSGVFVPQTALSREELYFSNISKTANVSKSISIPNEDLSDDTTPSVARKFLNEVKITIVTLQRVVKQRMTIETHNWASSAHQEFHKIIREEIFPIVNQVNARLQNFEIQFLKEAAKFVGDFKYISKEADASLAKHKIMEMGIDCLLKAVDTSKNTKFAKQPNVEILSKISETNALSKPITSNSVSTPQVSKGVNNAKVIGPCMFRISPDKVSREAKKVLSNTKNDRVPSASKSSQSKNKEVNVEEHHRNLLLSKKNKHISSACNNSKIDSQDVISKVVCVVCKKCLNSVNHDVCLNNYVNDKKSRGRKHKANVSKNETQQKNQPEIKQPKKPEIKKPKKVGFIRRLATPKPKKPRFLLRWSPTGKMSDHDGKLIVPSNSESHVDCSNGDNACTSNAMEPKIKRFPNSTSLLGRNDHVAAIMGFGDLQ
nr:hypothetical protein [Tanacetum cinerariifolium]